MNKTWTTATITMGGKNKLRCQDASWAGKYGETVVLTVADGLGSSSQSDLGSAACMTMTQQIASKMISNTTAAPYLASSIFAEVVFQWQAWANKISTSNSGITPSSVKSTFTLAIIKDGWLSIRSIGDSLCFVKSGGSPIDAIMIPHRSDSGGVASIGDYGHGRNVVSNLDIFDPSLQMIALTTDGLEAMVRRRDIAKKNYRKTVVTDIVDRNLDRILEKYALESNIGFLYSEFKSGFVDRPGSKGDDIAVALGVRHEC